MFICNKLQSLNLNIAMVASFFFQLTVSRVYIKLNYSKTVWIFYLTSHCNLNLKSKEKLKQKFIKIIFKTRSHTQNKFKCFKSVFDKWFNFWKIWIKKREMNFMIYLLMSLSINFSLKKECEFKHQKI